MFNDSFAITYPTSYTLEKRYFVTGKIKDKLYTSIITHRNTHIRIISVRRARKKEIEQYERIKHENNHS